MSSISAARYSARRLMPSRHVSQVNSREQGLSSLTEQRVSGSKKTGYIVVAISGHAVGSPSSQPAGSSAPGQRAPKDSNLLSYALLPCQSCNQVSSCSFALLTGNLCRADSKKGGKGGEGKHAQAEGPTRSPH